MARRLRHFSAPRGLILLYHRIEEPETDPWSLCVSPAHFSEHLAVLRRWCKPTRLEELLQFSGRSNGAIPGAVVTFDDGYADNLHNAKPLLERADIPATAFIISGYVGQSPEFWWDEMERLFLQPGTLPPKLKLRVEGQTHEWVLGDGSRYSEEEYRRHSSWKACVAKRRDPTIRQRLYRSVYHALYSLEEDERQRALTELRSWAGYDPAARPSRRPLSTDELVQFSRGGLVEIGAHTRTHPILRRLPADRQAREIGESKSGLEEMVQRPVRSFAYPYGSRAEYAATTRDLVRQAGFACACSTRCDAVWRDSDPFELPRVSVDDWDGDTFESVIRSMALV